MKLFVKNIRDISFVPNSIWIVLFISLSLQCLWHWSTNRLEIRPQALSAPPKATLIRLGSLDDPVFAAKLVMLWLQAFDNQPGVSIPLKDLDYKHVGQWLDLILALDYKMQYPLLAAIRFYAEVPDENKQRQMIQYVTRKFMEHPNQRWPAMAHAVYIAKYRIKDPQLAVQCARLIRQYATSNSVPFWAKQMEIFVLEDMGELESSKILIGGLLDSGELNDVHQRKFLTQRLYEIEARQTTITDID